MTMTTHTLTLTTKQVNLLLSVLAITPDEDLVRHGACTYVDTQKGLQALLNTPDEGDMASDEAPFPDEVPQWEMTPEGDLVEATPVRGEAQVKVEEGVTWIEVGPGNWRPMSNGLCPHGIEQTMSCLKCNPS